MEVYEYTGRYEVAIAEYQAWETLAGLASPEAAGQKAEALRVAFRAAGVKGYWRKRLDLATEEAKRRYDSLTRIAMLYTRLGENEEALKWLDRAYAERDAVFLEIAVNAAFDALRADSRFQGLLARIAFDRPVIPDP